MDVSQVFYYDFAAADACLSSDTGSSAIVSNVKCGSCGQKGHNRRFERCPNYYTEKEKNRRDVGIFYVTLWMWLERCVGAGGGRVYVCV